MKTTHATVAASRREFLRGGARYALLAGIGSVAVSVAARKGERLPGQTCIQQGICRGCAVVDACGLPSALSFRQVMKRHGP
jgi:hypothetical protein